MICHLVSHIALNFNHSKCDVKRKLTQNFTQVFLCYRDYIAQAISVSLDICNDSISPTFSKLIGFSITLLILLCNMINVKWAVKLQVSFECLGYDKIENLQVN